MREISFQRDPSRGLTPIEEYAIPDYTPKPYTVPGSIEKIHDWPRFGHPNNFDALIESGDKNEVQTYVVGVLSGAILILSIAVFWFFIISILKILGQKKVGFLSGSLMRPESETTSESGIEIIVEDEKDNDHDIRPKHGLSQSSQNYDVEKSFKRKVIAVRAVFFLCGISNIIAGALFYSKGVASFRTSYNEVREGIDMVQATAYEAQNITDGVIQGKDQLDAELEPTRDGSICGANSELTAQITSIYDNITSQVEELKIIVEENLNSFSEDLDQLITLTTEIENSLSSANIFFYILIAISTFIVSIIVVMLVSVSFAAKGVSNCFTRFFTNVIIWPVFSLLLIMAWVFSTVFLVASLTGSDFCVRPDYYVQKYLNEHKDDFDSAIFAFIIFYVSGCTVVPDAEDTVRSILTQVRLITITVHDFSQLIGDIPATTLAQLCGVDDLTAVALKELSTLLHGTTHLVFRSMNGLIEILSCGSFNPIYTTFVHDALCSSGVEGLTWIFFTMLTVAISSMMMITFRAALYPVQEHSPRNISSSIENVEVLKYEQNSFHDYDENEGTTFSDVKIESPNEDSKDQDADELLLEKEKTEIS